MGGSISSPAINADTIFTGTIISPNGQTATCTATVTVNPGGGGGGGGPTCTLTASPASIPAGGSATLTWNGTQISNVDINNGVGTAKSSSGSATVSPTAVGSYTYTGTFHATNGQTLTCSAPLQVTGGGGGGGCTGNCGGGGGSPPPTITLSALPHVGTQPLAYLYLSQIPYTGLDLGPVGTTLYWLALIGFTLAFAYLMLFSVAPFANRSLSNFASRVSMVLNAQELAPARVTHQEPPIVIRESSDVLHETIPEVSRGYSSYDGFKSFAHNGALSIDDLVKGLSRESVAQTVHRVASSVIATAQVEPIYDHVEPIVENVPSVTEPVSIPADVRGLTSALVEGDRAAVFAGLRQHVRGGGAPERLVSSVACLLDDTYRARIDGTSCDPALARLTARLDTPSLERLVGALTTAIDSSYTDGVTGAKLAFTRALAVLGA